MYSSSRYLPPWSPSYLQAHVHFHYVSYVCISCISVESLLRGYRIFVRLTWARHCSRIQNDLIRLSREHTRHSSSFRLLYSSDIYRRWGSDAQRSAAIPLHDRWWHEIHGRRLHVARKRDGRRERQSTFRRWVDTLAAFPSGWSDASVSRD